MSPSKAPQIPASVGRPMLRSRGLLLFGIVATGLAASLQYTKTQRERHIPDRPNMYPSVDRSGGGI
ncbi:hypothetical protein F4775DRAFT_594297 [Biscogniauxia sp. FL1348]|nr:hypothetical protein F4775DRAFT_594297 [Biscogniauxia sp. FL1348]